MHVLPRFSEALMLARKVEVVCGSLAGLTGVRGVAYAVFGPTYMVVRGAQSAAPGGGAGQPAETAGRLSLAQMGLGATTGELLALVALCAVAAAAGALPHGLRNEAVELLVLAFATGLLRGAMVVTGFSVGVLLAPAAVLATAALLAGMAVGLRAPTGANSLPTLASGRGAAFGVLLGIAADTSLGLWTRGIYPTSATAPGAALLGALCGLALARAPSSEASGA